ncbi:MAG TPA: glycosyltransferase family 9 protein [Chitinispirillaceae bacterium]|nr:glycosyltransferase family 9 protein [Chitinispirillaceae bacterium]
MFKDTIKKVLIIQFKPFGDIFLSTSYLHSLKSHYKKCTINYLIGRDFSEAVASHPLVNNVIKVRLYNGFLLYCNLINLIIKARLGRYDIVIDQQNSTASRLITILSGAKTKAGWKGKRWESHLDFVALQPQGKQYAAERNLAFVRALGIKNPVVSMLFTINDDSRNFVNSFLSKKGINRKLFFTIAPGSKDPKKKWYKDGYRELCRMINERYNQPIIVLYAPYEYEDALAVAQSHPEYIHLAPKTNLNQAVAFIDASRIFVCNDCALNHLSTATTATAIGLFGNSSPDLWSPALSFLKHHHLFNPDWTKNNSNDFGITPEKVIDCIQEIMFEKSLTSA